MKTWRHKLCTSLKEIIQHKPNSSKETPLFVIGCVTVTSAALVPPILCQSLQPLVQKSLTQSLTAHKSVSTYLNFKFMVSIAGNHNFPIVLLNDPFLHSWTKFVRRWPKALAWEFKVVKIELVKLLKSSLHTEVDSNGSRKAKWGKLTVQTSACLVSLTSEKQVFYF